MVFSGCSAADVWASAKGTAPRAGSHRTAYMAKSACEMACI